MSWFASSAKSHRRQPRRGKARRLLRLESLEPREMLNGDYGSFQMVDGILKIEGTPNADTVEVRYSNLQVYVTMHSDNLAIQGNLFQYIPRSSIKRIEFRAGDGRDSFVNSTDVPCYLYGEEGDDTLSGGSGNDRIDGGWGSDKLYGNKGVDTIYGDGPAVSGTVSGGGLGAPKPPKVTFDDEIYGGDDGDHLFGERGRDILAGGYGNDDLHGGIDNDYLWGGPGDDYLHGEGERDWLCGGYGSDHLYGNGGDDNLYAADVLPYFRIGIPKGNWQGVGQHGNDELHGGPGEDVLQGWVGNDWLYGGDDDDILIACTGTNYLYGGKGDDKLWGGTGNDFLSGGDNQDTLYGHEGNDFLDGGDGKDALYGGPGVDHLYGGLDLIEDLLDGGPGLDHFYLVKGMPHKEIKDGEGESRIHELSQKDLDLLFAWAYFTDRWHDV